MTMISFRVADAEAAEAQLVGRAPGVDRSVLLARGDSIDISPRRGIVRSTPRRGSLDRWTEGEAALAAIADWGPAEDWSDLVECKRR